MGEGPKTVSIANYLQEFYCQERQRNGESGVRRELCFKREKYACLFAYGNEPVEKEDRSVLPRPLSRQGGFRGNMEIPAFNRTLRPT